MMISTFHFFEWEIGCDFYITESDYIAIPSLKSIPSGPSYTDNSFLTYALTYYVKESVGARGLLSEREISKLLTFHNLRTFLNIFTKSLFHKTEIFSYLMSFFLP